MSDDFDDDELEGEPCPFCAEPNHPPCNILCIHNVAWTWFDGHTEALGSATQLWEALLALCGRVYRVKAGFPEDAQMHARALTVPLGAQLVERARQWASFDEILQQLAGATTGDGWGVDGGLGGSGNCRYVSDLAQVAALAAQCKALCQTD
jgi:hypothetical protein